MFPDPWVSEDWARMRGQYLAPRVQAYHQDHKCDEVVNDTTSCDNFGLGWQGTHWSPKMAETLLCHPKYSLHHIAGFECLRL